MKKLSLFLLTISSLLLTSCYTAGYIAGGKQKTYQGEYFLDYGEYNLQQSKDKLKALLKKDGWNKTQELEKELKYQAGSGVVTGLLTAKNSSTTLTISFLDKNIKLNLLLIGNYNHGTEEKADKIFNEIKSQYQE